MVEMRLQGGLRFRRGVLGHREPTIAISLLVSIVTCINLLFKLWVTIIIWLLMSCDCKVKATCVKLQASAFVVQSLYSYGMQAHQFFMVL